jgi:hypothetical protein
LLQRRTIDLKASSSPERLMIFMEMGWYLSHHGLFGDVTITFSCTGDT